MPYLEKIANSLQEQGIDTAELAMEYLRIAYVQSLQKNHEKRRPMVFKPKVNYQIK